MSIVNSTIKVTLLKDGHTHAGKPIAKGESIHVSPATAAWMADPKRGLIAPINKSAAPAKKEG